MVTSPGRIRPSSVPRVMSGSLPGSISRCMMSWYFSPPSIRQQDGVLPQWKPMNRSVGL